MLEGARRKLDGIRLREIFLPLEFYALRKIDDMSDIRHAVLNIRKNFQRDGFLRLAVEPENRLRQLFEVRFALDGKFRINQRGEGCIIVVTRIA